MKCPLCDGTMEFDYIYNDGVDIYACDKCGKEIPICTNWENIEEMSEGHGRE